MPRRARQLAESEIYHVMLRGLNRDAIFLEQEDCERFLDALRAAKELSGCLVFAYCLMPNHVHLVLRAGREPIGSVVKRLGVRYAAWFNRKYGRVGHLFQDRFRSIPVEDDAYLVTLLRYVWSNPVKAGLTECAEDYRWSSRQLLGRGSLLVDEGPLRKLLGDQGLVDAASSAAVADEWLPSPDPADRPSDREVAELLRRACGADGPTAFRTLPPALRQRAIRELRTRSVSYSQIARVTGMSSTSVRRAQLMAVAEQG